MPFQLSERDLARLDHVHPDLVAVVKRAAELSPQRFMVVEGIRTVARQQQLVATGKSKTMNSRHIPTKTGLGHAVDLAPLDSAGKIDWNASRPFTDLGAVMKRAARDLGIDLEWGGDWPKAWDKPHYQLPWKSYPGSSVAALGSSRTMRGLTSAAAGQGVQQGADATTLQTVVETLQPAAEASATVATMIVWLKIGGTVLTLGGLAYAAYARWDDAGRPLPRLLRRLFGAVEHQVGGE